MVRLRTILSWLRLPKLPTREEEPPASLGAKEQSPDQSSPVATTAGFGTSRLAAVFGNSGFGAKPLQPFPTPSRPPGAVAANEYLKRSKPIKQQQPPLKNCFSEHLLKL